MPAANSRGPSVQRSLGGSSSLAPLNISAAKRNQRISTESNASAHSHASRSTRSSFAAEGVEEVDAYGRPSFAPFERVPEDACSRGNQHQLVMSLSGLYPAGGYGRWSCCRV